MSVVEEFENAEDELEALLVEVLGFLMDADEVGPAWPELMLEAPGLLSQLAIRDTEDHSYASVEVRTGANVARMIAARMMSVPDPSPEDLLDTLAELGNIVAGNVKALIGHHCQLSLPAASAFDVLDDADQEGHGAVRVGACVLGHLVELAVRPMTRHQINPDIYWPASIDELQESQQ